MENCIATIEETFRLHADKRTLMGGLGSLTHGQILRWPESSSDPDMPSAGPDRRFAAMPAYVGGDTHKIGIKWYGSNVNNPDERGLPRSIHIIVLNDPDSGNPVAIIDGTLVSAMRTGAVAGVGAKAITDDTASTAAVIGTGVIGRTATMALDASLSGLESIDVFDIDHSKAEAFASELTEETGTKVTALESTRGVVTGADIVVIATAGAHPPTVEDEWLHTDTVLIPLGDADLPLETVPEDGVYVDDRDNIADFIEYPEFELLERVANRVDSGDYSLEGFTPIPSIISGEAKPNHSGRAVFLTYGLPIEDVTWANEVYEQAVSDDRGQILTLFEESHWK